MFQADFFMIPNIIFKVSADLARGHFSLSYWVIPFGEDMPNFSPIGQCLELAHLQYVFFVTRPRFFRILPFSISLYTRIHRLISMIPSKNITFKIFKRFLSVFCWNISNGTWISYPNQIRNSRVCQTNRIYKVQRLLQCDLLLLNDLLYTEDKI